MDKEIATLPPQPSPLQLDKLAANISQAISTAMEASIKRAYARPSGHSWWNDDCTKTVKSLHRTIGDPDSTPEVIQDAKRIFKHVVRNSKRNYWRARVDGFKDPQDIFKAVKWNRTEGSLPISPLREGVKG